MSEAQYLVAMEDDMWFSRRVKEGLGLLIVSFSFAGFIVGSFSGSHPAAWTETTWIVIAIVTVVIWVAFITVFPYVENPPKHEDHDSPFF